MSKSWHLQKVGNAASLRASHFFCPVFAKVLTFNLFKLPTVKQLWLKYGNNDNMLYSCCLLCVFAAYCISMNSIAVSLICIWTGAAFWSVAPLLGWGSYTGLFSHTDLEINIYICFSLKPSSDLCVLRSRLRHLWGGLVQSKLLHHPQILHHLHPHLLLFHPCDDHALLLRLHYQHSEKHQCNVGWWFTYHPPEEGGERCDTGRWPGEKVYYTVFYWEDMIAKVKLDSLKRYFKVSSRNANPDNCPLMFLSRFPLWSALLSSWPGRHMQWCLCGLPGASTCQAQPASSPVSLPSLPASTTRSSTSAWAPNSARTSLCCCRAWASGGSWCTCSTLRTSNPRLRPRLKPQHFLSSNWRGSTKRWRTRTILTATRESTALFRLLRRSRRSSTSMCPHTLKHHSTGATGSEDTWLEPLLELQVEIDSNFVFFGLTHVNKLYV